MSFDSIQVFNPQAKSAFVEFLLGRINTYFIASTGGEWSEEHSWTVADFDRILEEYSVSSIVFPFSKAQLLVIVGWLRNDPKGDLLKRYSDQEIVSVLAQVKEGDKLNEYVLNLVQRFLDWDECPRGYSNGGEDREKDLTNTIVMEILNRPRTDPPILDDVDEDGVAGADEEETSLLDAEGDELSPEAPEEEAEDPEGDEQADSEEDQEATEEDPAEVEEIEIEEIEAPPKKKAPPAPKSLPKEVKKEEPKENFTPPKGVVLTGLVSSLIKNYMEPAKTPSPQTIVEQRKKIVKYATERLGAKETLQSFIKALVEQTIDVCDRAGKDDYEIDTIVDHAVTAYRNNTRNPKSA